MSVTGNIKIFSGTAHPELAQPENVARFPELETFTIREVFGDWQQAQDKHFNDGGVFDAIYGL